MSDKNDNPKLSESVEELREKLEAMKRLIEENDQERVRNKRKEATCKASIIDGNFLSFVFVIVLILIVSVSVYAFFNLFIALKKKYPGPHSEL